MPAFQAIIRGHRAPGIRAIPHPGRASIARAGAPGTGPPGARPAGNNAASHTAVHAIGQRRWRSGQSIRFAASHSIAPPPRSAPAPSLPPRWHFICLAHRLTGSTASVTIHNSITSHYSSALAGFHSVQPASSAHNLYFIPFTGPFAFGSRLRLPPRAGRLPPGPGFISALPGYRRLAASRQSIIRCAGLLPFCRVLIPFIPARIRFADAGHFIVRRNVRRSAPAAASTHPPRFQLIPASAIRHSRLYSIILSMRCAAFRPLTGNALFYSGRSIHIH